MVLDDKNCWESHPFTVASVSDRSLSHQEVFSERAPLLSPVAQNNRDHDMESNMKSTTDHMTFLIRPYDSFTSRLRELAVASRPLRVLVEGPYGHTHPLHLYEHVVFLVGGTGVITPLSYLPLLLGASQTPEAVELHWAVREAAFVRAVAEEYLDDALRTNRLSVEVYMSGGIHSQNHLPSRIQQHSRRPDVSQIVTSAANKAGRGSLAVVACGPERMVDDARLAVVNTLRSSDCDIDYFQESFSW